MHEIFHTLALSSAMFQFYWDTTTMAVKNLADIVSTVTIRGLSTQILKTDNVLYAARKHYGIYLIHNFKTLNIY